MGGYSVGFDDQVFSVDLNDLIIYAISQPNLSSSPTQWQSILEAPVRMSAALAINDRLFALGGCQDSSAIYLYQPSGKEAWVYELEDYPPHARNASVWYFQMGKYWLLEEIQIQSKWIPVHLTLIYDI